MAFQHFHKHRSKYLAFFVVAMLFSVFAFSIPTALISFAQGMGSTAGSWFVFTTSAGKEVGISSTDWQILSAEMRGFATLRAATVRRLVYDGVPLEHTPAAHAILLAEADAVGIEVPPELADSEFETFKLFLQLQTREKELTNSDLREILRRYSLNDAAFLRRQHEVMRVEAYLRTFGGLPVQNPEQIVAEFGRASELVGLEYVVLPFDRYRQELLDNPPPDAELETWFKALPAQLIRDEYTRAELYTLDVALVDADAWDPATAAAVLPGLAAIADPTDDEVLNECKRDPLRYAGGTAPAAIADLTPEKRAEIGAKIKKDRQIELLIKQARAEFDAAVAALPKIDEPTPDAPPKSEDERKAAVEELRTKHREAFAQMALKYGLTLQHHEDHDSMKLGELDPPKSLSFQWNARGTTEPGKIGAPSQSALPARDCKWGWIVRKDGTKPSEPLAFAEARGKALEQWAKEKSEEKARATARQFCADLLAEARKNVPAERLSGIEARRDQVLADLDKETKLEAPDRERRKTAEEEAWFLKLAAAVGPVIGDGFGAVAAKHGLEVKSIAPQRRDVANSPYFRERFDAPARFLLDQDDPRGEQAFLMGFGAGMVSGVLVDDIEKAVYVAKVTRRERPTIEAMSPSDRDRSERLAAHAREERNAVPSHNPFSMANLIRRHHPKVLTVKPSDRSSAPTSPYGY